MSYNKCGRNYCIPLSNVKLKNKKIKYNETKNVNDPQWLIQKEFTSNLH